ncbi:type 4b pilus protein PilO2 [Bosea sp. RAC05]|uniref:type 4b pilus protein PilO2 n=1 Tax=Bosea sp. RAC05 TaxID=1842539 RepID=UPI00083D0A90|nr:type 4b pilus protein PilO2 [Bosea sp. RAC05]AOG02829.1 pilin accessory family protein [Bosea sp. RAC05]
MADADKISVLKIGGKKYAVNLFWNEAEDSSRVQEAARREAARQSELELDLFCVRQGVSQYGLGRKRLGHSKGMASLAGHMADSRPGSWLGVFSVDDGYYILAVRDNEILGETDRVFSDELDARTQFEEFLTRGEWSEIYAPASLSIDGAQDQSIETFIASGRPPRLQDINRVGSAFKWIVIGGVVVAIIFGGLLYQKYQAEAEYQEMLRNLEAQARNNLPGRKQQEVEVPPMPWEGRYSAAKYLPACSEAMKRAVLDIPGWKPKAILCNGTGSSVSMNIDRSAALGQGGGTINWIRWALNRKGLDRSSISPVGDNGAEATWSISGDVEVLKPALTPPRLAEARRYLQSWLEETFTQVRFTSGDKNQFFETLKFRFETPYDPSRFSDILGRVEGLTIDRVSLDLARYVYTVEGAVHEKFELPAGVVAANRSGKPQEPARAR